MYTSMLSVCVCTCFPGRKHLLQGVRGHLSDSVLQPLTDQPAELIHCVAELKLQREDPHETAVLLDRPTARHLTQSGFTLFGQMEVWCVECGSHRKSSLHAG